MSPQSPSWSALLDGLLQGGDLSSEEATALMRAWLAEELSPVQTGAFLAGAGREWLRRARGDGIRSARGLPAAL